MNSGRRKCRSCDRGQRRLRRSDDHQIDHRQRSDLRAGLDIVMNNATNLSTGGSSFLISQGGNRIGGATGGTTGFTSTVAQQ